VVATTGSEPAVAVESAGAAIGASLSGATGQAQRAEQADEDVFKMTLEVKSETEALRREIDERLQSEPEVRERFEAEMRTAGVKAEMFVDTPDDLPELM
jgi:hypothetical protein